MINDTSVLNPKGNVKLELYDKDGIFFTKEKKNLVVTDANKIIAEMLSDPSKVSRASMEDKGDTKSTPDSEGNYHFKLSVNERGLMKAERDVSSSNTETEIVLSDLKDVHELTKVMVGNDELLIDEDVFIKDAELGVMQFKVAPTNTIQVEYVGILDRQNSIIKGTESLRVGNTSYSRGIEASDENRTYLIDYELGLIKFETPKTNVLVSYDYFTSYGLGFMSLGGIPEGHPANKPVSFSNTDKNLKFMNEEFDNARVPIIFPSTIESAKPELEVLPTKPIAFNERKATVYATKDESESEADKIYEIETEGEKLLRIVSAYKVKVTEVDGETETEEVSLIPGVDIKIKDAGFGEIELTDAPEEDQEIVVEYKTQKDSRHLEHQLGLSPVVELVSVIHQNSETGEINTYEISKGGVVLGEGDVWLLNQNAGFIQFSTEPSNGVTVETPGNLTIEYKVNSGTTVKFVADFPKGVPGPMRSTQEESFVSSGETTFELNEVVMKDDEGNFQVLSVKKNGDEAVYEVHPDGKRVSITGIVSGDSVEIKYHSLKTVHEVYQVAMFDIDNRSNSKMFNISGIGPVTKDEKTGMRVTWSVTF